MSSPDPSGLGREIYVGLQAGRVDFAAYLPDSVLSGLEQLLDDDPEIHTLVCSREDEGVAVTMGAALAGRLPAVLMEGSGVGYCALILARAVSQRTSLLLLFSHTRAASSRFDYHGTSRVVGEAVCNGLGIPLTVIDDSATARARVTTAAVMAKGQSAVVAVAVPGYLRT